MNGNGGDVLATLTRMREWARKVESRLETLEQASARLPVEVGGWVRETLQTLERVEDELVKPEELLTLRVEIADLQAKGRELKERLETLEAQAILDVGFEIGENGKPRYPNEKMRAAEVKLRLSRDEEYARVRGELDEVLSRIEQARANLETLSEARAQAHLKAHLAKARADVVVTLIKIINGGEE